jgi:O-antigen ligase
MMSFKEKILATHFLLLSLCVMVGVATTYSNLGTGAFQYVSLYYFLSTLLLTSFSPVVGLFSLLFLLPFSPGIHSQVAEIFSLQLKATSNPGLELALGFISGYLLKSLRENGKEYFFQLRWLNSSVVLPVQLLQGYLGLSCTIAICRNLWQSASSFSAKGLLFNLVNHRFLSFKDDYFPINDYYSLSVACLVILISFNVLRSVERLQLLILRTTFASALFVGGYGIIQWFWQIGSYRDGWLRGVQGTWPDLHSYAGFIVIPLVSGFAYFWIAKGSKERIFIACCQAMAFAALLASGSRATVAFAVLGMTTILFLLGFYRKTTKWPYIVSGLLVAVLSLALLIQFGYKDLTFYRIKNILTNMNFETINNTLTYRPENFIDALKMIRDYPILGLGQGGFYRASSINGYATSSYFLSNGGDHAHNYFLQTFAELGLVGVFLYSGVLFRPTLAARRQPELTPTLLLLCGVSVGNLFAHSLLVREMLIINGIYVGALLATWQLVQPKTSNISRGTKFLPAIAFLISLMGIVEVGYSFYREPFTYGRLCFRKNEMYQDGWTDGLYIQKLNHDKQNVVLEFEINQPDINRRSIDIDFGTMDADRKILSQNRSTYQTNGIFKHQFPSRSATSVYWFLKTSRCFSPINFGINMDSRRLGVNVKSVE